MLSGVGMCIIRWVRRGGGGGGFCQVSHRLWVEAEAFKCFPGVFPHTDPNSVTVSKPPRKDRQANVSHSISPGCFALHAVAAKIVYSGEKSLVVSGLVPLVMDGTGRPSVNYLMCQPVPAARVEFHQFLYTTQSGSPSLGLYTQHVQGFPPG